MAGAFPILGGARGTQLTKFDKKLGRTKTYMPYAATSHIRYFTAYAAGGAPCYQVLYICTGAGIIWYVYVMEKTC